jgi:hypothetical protein
MCKDHEACQRIERAMGPRHPGGSRVSVIEPIPAWKRPCPKCHGKQWIAIEYHGTHPEHYDGISEWVCRICERRIGRWSRKVLGDGEYEKRYGGVE